MVEKQEEEMTEDYTEEQRLAYIKAARNEYEEYLEIRNDAPLSLVSKNGAWVQGWVFISKELMELHNKEEE